MSKPLQAIRGMNDLLPEQSGLWQQVEARLRDTLQGYGYQEIRTPIVEKTELFARSIGQATDIVEKEMYTFEDRNGDSLSLRPEGTAACVRAGIERGLLHNQMQRFWYAGPMFRHERPQKGRYRQFHQVGVEAFGMPGPDIDAELILMSARLWQRLELRGLTLELNSLGTTQARAVYRVALVEYLNQHRDRLDTDSLDRLQRNPLRVLDSKNPDVQQLVSQAPRLLDFLDTESLAHFERLQAYLKDAGIDFEINTSLVRGLDYYSRTVFEWKTDKLGAQSAVCAGGRFDGLVERLGGKAMPAAGFAIGLERLLELVSLEGMISTPAQTDVYMVLLNETAEAWGMKIAERLRNEGMAVLCHCGGGSMKSQMKKADKSGSQLALIIGEDECAKRVVGVKQLRHDAAQEFVAESKIIEAVQQHLAAAQQG